PPAPGCSPRRPVSRCWPGSRTRCGTARCAGWAWIPRCCSPPRVSIRKERPMLDPEKVKERIAAALPGSEVEVKDLTGTGDHFEARVVSQEFDGKSMVDQHK